jgi:hypothetical protein
MRRPALSGRKVTLELQVVNPLLQARPAAEKSMPASDIVGAAARPDRLNDTLVTTPAPFTAAEPKLITWEGVVAAAFAIFTPSSEIAKVRRNRKHRVRVSRVKNKFAL